MYRYGWMGWVWRLLALLGIGGATLCIYLAVSVDAWALLAVAVSLGVPSVALPWVVAARIDRVSEVEIIVTNLFYAKRRVSREALGRPKVRAMAGGDSDHIRAPRAWIPVRRSWPIYLDLWADIPDAQGFRRFFRLHPSG